jgi:hypothetical protein
MIRHVRAEPDRGDGGDVGRGHLAADPLDRRAPFATAVVRRVYVGNGLSASPVAADRKIYLSSEDGEMLVVSAGRTFAHLATNSMGDLLMATPALSEGVRDVRTAKQLFAIGSKR